MISDAVKQQFDDLVTKHKVVLFMKGNKHFPQCGFSSRVVGMLKELGTPFETVNVLSSNEIRDGIKEYSNWPTIPQLYVGGEFIGGCDIVTEMFQSGELHKKIGVEEKKVEAPTITIEPSAANAIKAADEGDGTMLRLEVSAQFQYELYFDQKKPGDFEIESNGVKVLFDKQSASRANGLVVSWVEGNGGAFKIENPTEPPHVKPLGVKELKSWIDEGKTFELLDVRPDDERNIAKIEQSKKFEESMFSSLAKDTPIVFQCHHGGRSRNASERAIKEGFTKVWNLEGGIEAWSTQVDPKVARY